MPKEKQVPSQKPGGEKSQNDENTNGNVSPKPKPEEKQSSEHFTRHFSKDLQTPPSPHARASEPSSSFSSMVSYSNARKRGIFPTTSVSLHKVDEVPEMVESPRVTSKRKLKTMKERRDTPKCSKLSRENVTLQDPCPSATPIEETSEQEVTVIHQSKDRKSPESSELNNISENLTTKHIVHAVGRSSEINTIASQTPYGFQPATDSKHQSVPTTSTSKGKKYIQCAIQGLITMERFGRVVINSNSRHSERSSTSFDRHEEVPMFERLQSAVETMAWIGKAVKGTESVHSHRRQEQHIGNVQPDSPGASQQDKQFSRFHIISPSPSDDCDNAKNDAALDTSEYVELGMKTLFRVGRVISETDERSIPNISSNENISEDEEEYNTTDTMN